MCAGRAERWDPVWPPVWGPGPPLVSAEGHLWLLCGLLGPTIRIDRGEIGVWPLDGAKGYRGSLYS